MDNNFIISLTTIPSRINLIEPVIISLLNQIYSPKMIYINLPKKYNRFNTKIIIPKFLKKYEKVKIFYINDDYGPATKFIGALLNPEISRNDIIVVTDDDIIKKQHWSHMLLSQYDKNRVTSFVEKKLGKEIIWGYLGYTFQKNIFNIDDMLYFYDKVKRECYLVDDHWLTGYCHHKKINIYNIPIITNKYINKGEIKNNVNGLVNLNGTDGRLYTSEKCRHEIQKKFDCEFPFWCCMGCCVNGKRKTEIETFQNNASHTVKQINNKNILLCMIIIIIFIMCFK
jgi:hypothetical protein